MAKEDADQQDLLGIGEFARLTGLAISTLRHYHQQGLLVPVEVDAWSGYRRYRPDQEHTARIIRAMRCLQMPLEGIRRLLRADEASAPRIWATHRARLEEGVERSRRALALIDAALRSRGQLTAEGVTALMDEEDMKMVDTVSCRLMGVTLCVPDVDAASRFYERALGIQFESEAHPGGPRHLNACGGTWKPQEFFLFTLWPGDDPSRRASIDFTVDDVDAAYRRALDAGAAAHKEPYDSGEYPRHASFADPFGNHVNVYVS
jgi:DNA-binding transcriptional MerR regulator/predicted enzyme related to lactoylglutathione lyase